MREHVIRYMPETNSSSSHCVCIDMRKKLLKPGDDGFNIRIEDGVLYIPPFSNPWKLTKKVSDSFQSSFGQQIWKFNDPLTKLQYVCGLYCYNINDARGQKRIISFTRRLRKIFDVKKVVYEWDKEYVKEVYDYMEEHGLTYSEVREEDFYRDVPDVDHESLDIVEEIGESTETLRHFILSPSSWLYLCGCEDLEGTYYYYPSWFEVKEDESLYQVSCHFPEPLGRVDSATLYNQYGFNNILFQFIYDKMDKKVKVDNNILNNLIDKCYPVERAAEQEADDRYLMFSTKMIKIDEKTGKAFCIFYGSNVDSWLTIKLGKKKRFSGYSTSSYLDSNPIKLYDSELSKNMEEKFEEGKDYIYFPLTITCKYGKIL